jgi:RecA-family ATPase
LPEEGKMEICGAPGVMKSWLAQYTGFCTAAGIPWLGINTIQSRTLIINFEMTKGISHERSTSMLQAIDPAPDWLYTAAPGTLFIDQDDGFEVFENTIRHIQPSIVILDYLGTCFSGDVNKAQDVSKLTQKLDYIMRQYHITIILLHHTNKNPLLTGGTDKSSGSIALPGWMDTVLYMVKQPGGIQLQFSKTRHVSFGDLQSINLEFNGGVFTRRQ